jgi:hypothetical protein
VKKLFPRLSFDLDQGVAAKARPGQFEPLNEDLAKIPLSPRFHRDRGHFLRGLTAGCIRWLAKIGVLSWLAGYRYVMAPTMVSMVGTLPAESASKAA